MVYSNEINVEKKKKVSDSDCCCGTLVGQVENKNDFYMHQIGDIFSFSQNFIARVIVYLCWFAIILYIIVLYSLDACVYTIHVHFTHKCKVYHIHSLQM